MKEVVYIADLDQDVDDVVAAHYLYNHQVLQCVVCDPLPKSNIGKERMKMLVDLGIEVVKKLPNKCKYVFVGGALTEISRYIMTRHIDCLVMNGGYVGSNLVYEEEQLDKFKGKETVRTFNLNCDVIAADRVFKSSEKQIGKIILVGKNVCHSSRNTESDFWKDEEYKSIFKKYHVKPGKCQHDMLACHEGLVLLGIGGVEKNFCKFSEVRPFNKGLNGNMTLWGSVSADSKSSYRVVTSAVGFVD